MRQNHDESDALCTNLHPKEDNRGTQEQERGQEQRNLTIKIETMRGIKGQFSEK